METLTKGIPHLYNYLIGPQTGTNTTPGGENEGNIGMNDFNTPGMYPVQATPNPFI
jgi:hypothetical protein